MGGVVNYQFEISVGPCEEEVEGDVTPPEASDSFSVTMGFASGEDEFRTTFWKLYEAVQNDTQRTNRKWRRLMAQAGGKVPAPQAIPASKNKPEHKKNLYEKNSDSVQSALA